MGGIAPITVPDAHLRRINSFSMLTRSLIIVLFLCGACGQDKMPNCADFKDDCATDAFIQKQCAATCGVGAAKAAAPANDPKKDGYIKELEAVVDELAVPHRPYA